MSPPPRGVLDAFGIAGEPVPFPGGEGRAYAAGSAVLKPVDDEAEAAWIADVFNRIEPDGVRVPTPIRSSTGEWIARGWAAWSRVEGAHGSGRWADVLEACDALHRALAYIECPELLRSRRHQWAVGDRVAWDEEPVPGLPEAIASLVGTLTAARRPTPDAPVQVIHGDLTGNILFAEGLPPAVIDFAPYCRPVAYARAIIAFDAVTWEGADRSVLDLVGGIAEMRQWLIRAAIFRLVAAGILLQQEPRRAGSHGIEPYERSVRLILA